jgi:hypothetical protein
MITLTEAQRQGADFTFDQLQKWSCCDLNMPVGSGRTIILCDIARRYAPRMVVFISSRVEMRYQFERVAARMELMNTWAISGKYNNLEKWGTAALAIMCETMRDHINRAILRDWFLHAGAHVLQQ